MLEPLGKNQYQSSIFPNDFFIQDHVVGGKPLLPGSFYLEMALQAFNATSLRNMLWCEPLIVEQEKRLSIDCSNSGTCQIQSYDDAGKQHIHAYVRAHSQTLTSKQCDSEALKKQFPDEASSSYIYETLRQVDFIYGPSFQTLLHAYGNDDNTEAIADWRIDSELAKNKNLLRALVLESAFQTIGLVLKELPPTRQLFVPFAFNTLTVAKDLSDSGVINIRRVASREDQHRFNIDVYDLNANLIVEICSYTVRDFRKSKL